MTSAPEDTSHDSRPDTACGQQLGLTMAIQCRNPTLPSFGSTAPPPVSRHSRPVQESNVPMPTPGQYLTSAQLPRGVGPSSTTISSRRALQRVQLPSTTWASAGSVMSTNTRDFPINDSGIAETGDHVTLEPASKRCKLSDDGWIQEALKRGQEERRAPDPHPMPQLTPPAQFWEPHTRLRPNIAATQPQAQPSYRWLSPSGVGQSPGTRSASLSRRPSSAYSTSSRSHSPALTQRSITSANLRGPSSPPEGSILGAFSGLELGSRSNSVIPDSTDSCATFGQIHNVPRVSLPPRTTAHLSKLEKLPKKIFMRIMMYCGYKDQVLLKKCSSNLYLAVDLEIVPWEEKTSTILLEERNNPRNFPKKPPKTQDADEEEDGADKDKEVNRSKRTPKRKKAAATADPSSPKPVSSKTRAHVDTSDKWGCYCCYKILPAHYFEGALLEDKEGRTPKSNKLRGANPVESDKKVDMRVEYVQILEAVPGRKFPDWLSEDTTAVPATDKDTYLRERMERGVDCDDLRLYYRNITRDLHLVAPIRGVTPVFTPASLSIPSIKDDMIAKANPFGADLSQRTIHIPLHTPLPAIQTREEDTRIIENEPELFRPLYKIHAENIAHSDADSASFTYQIRIPKEAVRDVRPLTLPKTEPVSRICLPQEDIPDREPVLEAGDVVSLRRICIPCGTKFAVYRRNCNRKIISKTDEQWWVCDCPEVRLAGRSTGCPSCGRKVIY